MSGRMTFLQRFQLPPHTPTSVFLVTLISEEGPTERVMTGGVASVGGPIALICSIHR